MNIQLIKSRTREVKLFRNNRSQAVRIPAEFELPGDRVLIRREGAKLIIEPVTGPRNVKDLLAPVEGRACAWPRRPIPRDRRPSRSAGG